MGTANFTGSKTRIKVKGAQKDMPVSRHGSGGTIINGHGQNARNRCFKFQTSASILSGIATGKYAVSGCLRMTNAHINLVKHTARQNSALISRLPTNLLDFNAISRFLCFSVQLDSASRQMRDSQVVDNDRIVSKRTQSREMPIKR